MAKDETQNESLNELPKDSQYNFRGKYAFLSNLYKFKKPLPFTPSDYGFADKTTYQVTSAEQIFQMMKTKNPGTRAMFQGLDGASARTQGRRVTLRPDWELVKDDVMRAALDWKFSQTWMQSKLKTIKEPTIYEITPNDREWGVVPVKDKDGNITLEGQNKLGRLLTQKRDELVRQAQTSKATPQATQAAGPVIAVTGHRKLFDTYNTNDPRYHELEQKIGDLLDKLQPSRVIQGMALGTDQLVAKCAIAHNIPVTAAIPFPEQADKWPRASQERYMDILRNCDEVHVVAPKFSREAYLERNRWMVDHADAVLAVFDGDQTAKSGTRNAVNYATKNDVTVYVIDPNQIGTPDFSFKIMGVDNTTPDKSQFDQLSQPQATQPRASDTHNAPNPEENQTATPDLLNPNLGMDTQTEKAAQAEFLRRHGLSVPGE